MSRTKLVCPFHVRSALTNIGRLRGEIDLVVTVSDARSPSVTDLSNDLMDEFRRAGVKMLHLVSKSDLSDLRMENSFNFKLQKSREPILRLIREALGVEEYKRRGYRPHLQVLVVGFPNTGKSTLINLLKGRRVALSENLPGKTRKISRFPIGDQIWVYDTPGILTPRHSGAAYVGRLFLINSIPNIVDNASEILEGAYGYLYRNYRGEIGRIIGGEAPEGYGEFLGRVAERFGFRGNGGEWDLERAEAKFLNILWSGRIRLNWDRDV